MFLMYNQCMAVKDSNKQINFTISKEDYIRLEKLANKKCRSVSKQVLLFVLDGLNNSEEKRDD